MQPLFVEEKAALHSLTPQVSSAKAKGLSQLLSNLAHCLKVLSVDTQASASCLRLALQEGSLRLPLHDLKHLSLGSENVRAVAIQLQYCTQGEVLDSKRNDFDRKCSLGALEQMHCPYDSSEQHRFLLQATELCIADQHDAT